MTAFQRVIRLKRERPAAQRERQENIDREILTLEPQLTHEEAVYVVRKYEIPYPLIP